MFNKHLLIVVLSALLCTLSACGQKGPLYEEQPSAENAPKSSEETPVKQ